MFSAFSETQYPQDNFLKIGQCNFHTQTVEFSANSASNQNSQIQCKVCVLQKIELVQILLAISHSAKCIILVKIQCKFCPQVKMQLVQSTWSKKTSAISFKVLVQSMYYPLPNRSVPCNKRAPWHKAEFHPYMYLGINVYPGKKLNSTAFVYTLLLNREQ